LNNVDVVIPRLRPSATFYGCALLRQFQSMGTLLYNSHDAIAQSRDKLLSLQILVSKGFPLPITGFAHSKVNISELIKLVGGAPLIIKLLEGTQGAGIVLAETQKAAESVIGAFKSLKARILVQEFIKEAAGKDLRLFVVNGKIIGCIQREAKKGEFRANLHLGGTASIVKTTALERKLAISAANAFGLKIAGVDIIRSSTGPLILEVNSSPGLEGIEQITGLDIAGYIIESIEKSFLYKKKKTK